jgi:hypothetical protein
VHHEQSRHKDTLFKRSVEKEYGNTKKPTQSQKARDLSANGEQKDEAGRYGKP